jgi:hypothetical protein
VSLPHISFHDHYLTLLENPFLVYAILKYRRRFEAVREFTLESGQQEIERQNQRRKSENRDSIASPVLSASDEDPRLSSGARSPLGRIPEENNPFAIGGDDSEDEGDGRHTPPQDSASVQTSRRQSMSSVIDESVPLQLRGMSEKARGKMPAGQPSFSRQNSMTSQISMSAIFPSSSGGFTPTTAWVSSDAFMPRR